MIKLTVTTTAKGAPVIVEWTLNGVQLDRLLEVLQKDVLPLAEELDVRVTRGLRTPVMPPS